MASWMIACRMCSRGTNCRVTRMRLVELNWMPRGPKMRTLSRRKRQVNTTPILGALVGKTRQTRVDCGQLPGEPHEHEDYRGVRPEGRPSLEGKKTVSKRKKSQANKWTDHEGDDEGDDGDDEAIVVGSEDRTAGMELVESGSCAELLDGQCLRPSRPRPWWPHSILRAEGRPAWLLNLGGPRRWLALGGARTSYSIH